MAFGAGQRGWLAVAIELRRAGSSRPLPQGATASAKPLMSRTVAA